MQSIIRIGSRESVLAVTQAEIVKHAVMKACPQLRAEIITMKTTGDKILDRNLEEIGGKGLFVKELDQALLEGKIDISVHSLKDMPMEIPEELPILAYTKRADPRDVLIYKPGNDMMPPDGVIGTSSKRRIIQLTKLYPDCSFKGIRGNVQTRLKKLDEQDYDATVLAAAGMGRLGIKPLAGRLFGVEEIVPAAGQGILAVQGRKGEKTPWLDCVRDDKSRDQALAERQFVTALGGGCSSPVAAYAQIQGNELKLTGLYYSEAQNISVTEVLTGSRDEARKTGEMLALKMQREYGGKL